MSTQPQYTAEELAILEEFKKLQHAKLTEAEREEIRLSLEKTNKRLKEQEVEESDRIDALFLTYVGAYKLPYWR